MNVYKQNPDQEIPPMVSALPKRGRPDTLRPVRKIYRGGELPRRRIDIPATEQGLCGRFALKLRGLMTRKGWSSKEVARMLTAVDVPISDRGVDVWLRGEAMPKAQDLEKIGEALGFRDYRQLLPSPRKRPPAAS